MKRWITVELGNVRNKRKSICMRIYGNCLCMTIYNQAYKYMHVFFIYMNRRGTGQKQREIQKARICLRLLTTQAKLKKVLSFREHMTRVASKKCKQTAQGFLTHPFFIFRCLLKELFTFTNQQMYLHLFSPTSFPLPVCRTLSEPQELQLSSESAGFFFLLRSVCCL